MLEGVAHPIGQISDASSRARLGVELAQSKSQLDTSSLTGRSQPQFASALASEGVRWTEAKRTPLTAEQAMTAIAAAFEAQTGRALSSSGRALLTAQWAHETGHGTSMFNYNFGGIKGAGPNGLSVAQRTREGFGSSERTITDGFRAYDSAEQGAQDYVRLLLSRYGSAVEAAEQGDAGAFVRSLRTKGYFTGDPSAYQRSIACIARQLTGEESCADGVNPDRLAAGTRGLGLDLGTFPATMHGTPRSEGRLVELMQAPVPAGLIAASFDYGSIRSPLSDVDQVGAAAALDMADQITRAALRIAQEDKEQGSTVETRTSLATSNNWPSDGPGH